MTKAEKDSFRTIEAMYHCLLDTFKNTSPSNVNQNYRKQITLYGRLFEQLSTVFAPRFNPDDMLKCAQCIIAVNRELIDCRYDSNHIILTRIIEDLGPIFIGDQLVHYKDTHGIIVHALTQLKQIVPSQLTDSVTKLLFAIGVVYIKNM